MQVGGYRFIGADWRRWWLLDFHGVSRPTKNDDGIISARSTVTHTRFRLLDKNQAKTSSSGLPDGRQMQIWGSMFT